MATIYYPVWITPNRKVGGWSWGQPCDTPREADRVVKERIAAGAILGCIVEFTDHERRPMLAYIRPASAKRTVKHWEDLWDDTEQQT